MANDLNQCNFIGRLGADPEERFLPNGDAVCNFRIAVGWKTKDKEGAEWVSIVTFDKLAEICAQYLVKGSQVFVSGRFKTEEYEKDGSKRYAVKIVADRMQMLGGKSNGAPESAAPAGAAKEPSRSSQGAQGGAFDGMEDDIPFACMGAGKSWRVI